MEGYSAKIANSSRAMTARERIMMKDTTDATQINAALKKAAEGELKGYLGYTELPLVSIDYNHCDISSVVDGLSTMVIGDNMAKILAWYDFYKLGCYNAPMLSI